MSNPDISNPYGLITWQNDSNNWRAEDVHRLQARGVNRFATTGDLSGVTENGSVAYIDDASDRHVRVRIVDDWRRILHSEHLRVPQDSSTGVKIAHTSGTSGGLSLRSNGAVRSDGTLEVGTAASITTAGVLNLPSSTTVQVSGGDLVVNRPVRGTSLRSDGAIIGASVGSPATHTLSGSLVVNGSPASITAATVTATSGVEAASANIVGTVTAATVSAPTVTTGTISLSNTDQLRRSASVNVVLEGSAIRLLAPAVTMRHNDAQTPAPVAGVVSSPDAPTAGDNYPDGTIWLRTS